MVLYKRHEFLAKILWFNHKNLETTAALPDVVLCFQRKRAVWISQRHSGPHLQCLQGVLLYTVRVSTSLGRFSQLSASRAGRLYC